jgi:hypothetical protein
MMFRKSVIALAAVAALGVTALSATDAAAKGGKGGGFHHHHGHYGHHGRHFGRGFGFYGVTAYAPDCYRVITRRGFVRTVCE